MKSRTTLKIVAGMASLFTIIPAANAQLSVFVDMDPLTPGIQSSISLLPGTPFSVDLWAMVGPAGLSSFSISAMFDTLELAPMPPGSAASQPPLPGGLAPIAPPDETMEPIGLIKSFNGGTFGLGPASVSFIYGSISFVAVAPLTDASFDVVPGYFTLPGIIDGSFDSSGGDLTPVTVFTGGKVDLVPEPGSIALLVGGVAMMLAARRRRSA